MATYYPKQIRKWPVHRNLLDDVDASHVNNLQSELESVMYSLGVLPHIYNSVETNAEQSTPIDNDPGAVVDDDAPFVSVARTYDPRIKSIDHGNVASRLDNIERGKQFHAFRLVARGLNISSSSTSISVRPKGIRFPKPSSAHDPYAMHNGMGVTLRKSGFWMFSGSITMTLLAAAASGNDGIYQAVVDWDNNFWEGMDRRKESGAVDHPVLNPVLFGFFKAGTWVTLRMAQSSGRTQRIRSASLSGVLIREAIGV